jgi:predicted membrane-bound mannosyltransferase
VSTDDELTRAGEDDPTAEGTTAEGTTAEGTTSEGTTSEGTTAEGTTAEGTTSEGTTSEGTTSEGITAEGITAEGITAEGITAEGITAEGSGGSSAVATATEARATSDDAVASPEETAPGETAEVSEGAAPTTDTVTGENSTASGSTASASTGEIADGAASSDEGTQTVAPIGEASGGETASAGVGAESEGGPGASPTSPPVTELPSPAEAPVSVTQAMGEGTTPHQEPAKDPAKPALWQALPAERDRPWSRWLGALAFAAAFAFALVTRLAFLDAKPLHHDEGVNAHFLFGLLSEGRYHYDPTNYHGPFLYFFGYLPFKVWGATPLGLRILPALCGALTLLLLLPLRRLLGWAGVACAAWLLAISPISTYVARTAIHETYFAFAVVAVVVLVVAYSERRRTWLPTLGALAVALAYANKETAVISYGAYACGLGLALLFAKELPGGLRARLSWATKSLRELWGKSQSWYPPVPHWIPAVAFLLLVAIGYLVGMGSRILILGSASDNSWQAYARLTEFAPAPAVGVLWAGLLALCVYLLWGLRHELKRYWKEQPESRRPWLIAIYLGATLMVILFSSFFSSVPGLTGLLSSLYHWVKRGVAMEKTGHEHPWPYYFKLLWRFEAPLMILAPLGIVVAAARRRAGDLLILGWGLSTIAVYTVLAYKTPWLVVNLILPLALLAGIGFGALGRFLGRWRRGWGEGVLALLTALLLIAPSVPPEPARQIESWERATTWPTLVASPSWPYLGSGEAPLVVRAPEDEADSWAHWRPEAAWWRLQWSLNVLSPDDSRYGPVYAQTDRGAVALFERLNREVAAGKKVSVVCSEYWPLPAYLYPGRASGYPSAVPTTLADDLYLLSQDQDNKAYERFRGWERRVFPLRTGVKLVLRARRPKKDD